MARDARSNISSGLIGKYMMAHFASGTWAMFDQDVENYMGTTGSQFMSYERYGKTSHKGAFGSTFITAGSALKTSDLGGFANARLDLFGPDLTTFMKRAARGLTRIGAFGEALPNIENRVEPVSDKDEFGMPLAKIVHSFIRMRSRCGTPISRRGSRLRERRARRRCGRRAATCRPSI